MRTTMSRGDKEEYADRLARKRERERVLAPIR